MFKSLFKKRHPYARPVDVDVEEWDAVVRKATVPVVVDFHATWCGPCQTMGGILREVAEEYDGQVLIAKVDVDRNPELAQKFKVRSMPTLMFMQNGKRLDKHVGIMGTSPLKKKINRMLGV